MFAIPCEKGAAGLSYVLLVAVRADQLIDAALVKFRRSSGFQCDGLKDFSNGIVRLRRTCAMFMLVFLNIFVMNFVCGPT